jgi:NAD(P)-dependent dehydrogenase (short-subunit alcohol dehydrogenase family)
MAGEKQQAIKPTCLITGVGPATGSALVRRFAQDYQVAMIARDQDRLLALEEEVPGSRSFICDVSDQEAFGQALDNIRARMGAPAVIIHNAVSGIWGDVLSIDPKRLQLNFQINTMALLQLIQAFGPDMVDAGHGSILGTGNTAAYRGRDQFAAFAPSKAAQRILLESAARLLGPKNIHVAYVAIDAAINTPMMRELLPDKPDAFFCQPDDIAEECFHLAHQPRSAWTFDTIIRPFGETW